MFLVVTMLKYEILFVTGCRHYHSISNYLAPFYEVDAQLISYVSIV